MPSAHPVVLLNGNINEKFHEALNHHMNLNGDTWYTLANELIKPGELFARENIRQWQRGNCSPRGTKSFEFIKRIETKYKLPANYL